MKQTLRIGSFVILIVMAGLLMGQVGQTINELTAIDSVVAADSIAIYDASGSDTNKATITQLSAAVSGALTEDSVGTVELDDDANTPTAGDIVVVETGDLSFDYITQNAGTDVTADLEEETHASEHVQGGGDDIEVEDLSSTCSANVMLASDGTDVDCTAGLLYNLTSGLVSLTHQTDGSAVQLMDLIGPNRATPTEDDEVYVSVTMESDGGNHEYSRLTFINSAVTDGSERGQFDLDLIGGGALVRTFTIIRSATTSSSIIGLLATNDQIDLSVTTADAKITEAGTDNGLTIEAATDITLTPTSGAVYLNDLLVLNPTDSPVACAAGTEGGVYYDASINEICFCDGSSYAQVDGGGACA